MLIKVISLLFFISLSFAQQQQLQQKPVVLWHGMGDDCCNVDSMGRIKSLIQHRLPNTFVHSIRIGNTIDDDHQAGFFGKIEEQVDTICKELSKIKELKNGFNAIGFSQGGLFLRAYVEQCNRPKVHRLITFGSPHAGVSDIPNCTNPKDFTCKWMRSLVHKGVYTDYIQNRVIQAQYFRDPNDQQKYLEKNRFLPKLNNERKEKNEEYRKNLASLDRFVMIRFSEDVMIKPSYTAWFWIEIENRQLLPLQNQTLYQDDWLGLKSLDDNGRLELLVCPGKHMQISDEYLDKKVIIPYLIEKEEFRMIQQ